MNFDDFTFDVSPLIHRANSEGVIRIRPRFIHKHIKFPAHDNAIIRLAPLSGATHDRHHCGSPRQNVNFPDANTVTSWHYEGDTLVVHAWFEGEQGHELIIFDKESNRKSTIQLYSLADDWYCLRPYKGDFHIHTLHSDGAESPELVAARCRQVGFDFAAISDHHRYEPSIQAIDYWSKYNTGLVLHPGEEVHPPDCQVHVLHFGGRESVNAMFRNDEARYRAEVTALIPQLGPLPAGLDPFPLAAAEWAFDKIRSVGGLGIFAHPHWYYDKRASILPQALIDELFKRRKFDGVEIIGGFTKPSYDANALAIVNCYEEWRQGGPFPMVGVSDAHHSNPATLFGSYYTIVLAESAATADLVTAMREGRCSAVEAPYDERVQCFGTMRMARYAHYLVKFYYPYHQWLCRTEGDVMISILGGEEKLAAILPQLAGRVAAWRERVFGAAT